MEEIGLKLLEQGAMTFLFIITIGAVGYSLFKFGTAILSMLKIFLDGLLDEFKGMIKSITELGDAERIAKAQHSMEHKEIITSLNSLKDEVMRKK